MRNEEGRVVASTLFKYEDYELNDSRVETKMNFKHYAPHANEIEIKALDMNGLFLQDVQAEIIVLRGNVLKTFTDFLQLPDTLMSKKIDLENDKPTLAEIPSDLFGASNCNYSVVINILTHDNQLLVSVKSATFYKSSCEIVSSTRNDTVRFEWKELGIVQNRQAEFWLNNDSVHKTVELPFEIPFNSWVKSYHFRIDSLDLSESFYTVNFDPHLDVSGGFQGDAINVKLLNPLKLELSWYLYQGGRLLAKGSGTEFDTLIPRTNLKKVHYVEFFYHIGGTKQFYSKTFTPNIDFLDVSIDLPDRIYPGQTLDATISVKDIFGKPVQDVDLTAFAYNSPLNYHVPDLEDYGTAPQKRSKAPTFSLRNKNCVVTVPFHYDYWNGKLCLDTIKYYQFTFPRNKLFRHTVETPDSTTQIAPYVMKNGEAVLIYVIEINDQPVYFSWTEQPKRYSFLVSDSVKQKVTLRLHDRAITLDSLFFETGKKTIFSIDLDSLPPKAKKLMLDTRDKDKRYHFTNAESNAYKHFISQFPIGSHRYFTYLKQNNTKYPIDHPYFSNSRYQVLVGPYPEGYMEYGEIRYRHEGGYSYKFEENVVYKYPLDINPKSLHFSSTYNITTLNDFALTPKVFNKIIENCQKAERWYPRNIRFSQVELVLDLELPIHPDSIATKNLVFRNVETAFALLYRNTATSKYIQIPPATYDVILLYEDGSYISFDSLTLKPYSYTKVNMTQLPLQEGDFLDSYRSSNILMERAIISKATVDNSRSEVSNTRTEITDSRRETRNHSSGPSTIKGEIKDKNGNAVPFLQVLLKQDDKVVNGAYTDEKGVYKIFGVSVGVYDITIGGTVNCLSFYTEKDIYIRYAEVKFVDFIMDCVTTELQEVAITYVPPIFSQDNTTGSERLTGEEVRKTPGRSITAIYDPISVRGNRSDGQQTIVDGVRVRGESELATYHKEQNRNQTQLLSETDDEIQDELQAAEERLYNEIMQLNSLRSNFSDVGFWEPRLYTNSEGEAKFTVTFPDNITQWNTIVYAMNRKLQTATLRKKIQSYKPLMAELRNPQFLVAGDTSFFAGNIRNYTQDKEISGEVLFLLCNDTVLQKEIQFTTSHQDKIQVTTLLTDSITTTYLFQRNDGYTDGEKRTIPVLPRGTEIADGTLCFLKSGDKKTVTADFNQEINITLTASPLDIYLNATYFLQNYRYDCNEQLASKLMGLLNYKLYQEYAGERFRSDKRIENIIKRLIDNRNGEQLWSWWGNSPNSNYWMSAHILRALISAQKAGYKVNLDFKNMAQDYVDTRRYRSHSLNDIAILNALSSVGTRQDYAAALELFDKEIAIKEHVADSIARAKRHKNTTSYLNEKLLLLEIRQQQNIGYVSDSIQKYLKTDILGAVYCDDGIKPEWRNNTLINTLIGYRIISRDTTLQHLKEAMQLYVLRTKERGWNTYQSATAVMTILPDLLSESASKKAPSTVVLSGKEQKELSEFPYATTLFPGEHLDVQMKSGTPLIYSDYQLKRVTTEHTGDGFKIETSLKKEPLTAGEPNTLQVTVTVKQANAEHVMIEIPIPAGCSYASKKIYNYRFSNTYETYREHFKDRVVIFCEKLPIGTYEYNIELLPRFSGSYHLNPAKVELMYFPVIYSNNEERKVRIE